VRTPQEALLNARVSEILNGNGVYRLSEAKGVVYAFKQADRLGFDLVDASLQYRGGQGLDLIFQSRTTAQFVTWEAKGGFTQKGLSALATDTRFLTQGSAAYNLDRLNNYLRFGDGANNGVANALSNQAQSAAGLPSYASFYGGRSTYLLPDQGNLIRPAVRQ
jgi:hypothetical protein